MLNSGNLFAALPDTGRGEAIEVLARDGGVEIERIVSKGHASPEGFWYEQERGEGVVVELTAGDWVWIEAGRRHRVEWTAEDEETVWLAVFVRAAGD